MRRAAALLFVLMACSTGQARRPSSPRVILLSFDGLGADALQKQRGLTSFQKMARQGLHIERVIPVTPTATAAAHVAILTGAPPNVTGIVANKFHEPGSAPGQLTDAFSAKIGAETLVQAARRAGKTVVSIAFPTVRDADFGITFVQSLTKSRMIHLKRDDFVDCGGSPPLFESGGKPPQSKAVCTAIEWFDRRVEVVASDTSNDGVENYDTLEFDGRRPDGRGWFATSTRADGSLYGSWSKILRFETSLNVTIYWGPVSRNEGYPHSFRQMIDDSVGFWPGQPDEPSAAQWLNGGDGIDADTFIEQNDRLSRFFTDAALTAARNVDFDLLLLYQPAIDKAEHQFLITLPSQRGYSEENRAIGERVRSRAYQAADVAAGAILRLGGTLVVTGDHGLTPIDMEVRLGNLAPHWQTYGNGNVGHLYGNENPEELTANLRATGYFERVERKTPRSHPNSGDIVVYSYPHIALNGARADETAVKPLFYGQHGGLSSHREFHTTLFARGPGVVHRRIAEDGQLRMARLISGLLGIDPPREAL